MKKTIIVGLGFLIILSMLNGGCIDNRDNTDPYYEYYYYLKIKSNSTNSYTLKVPFPVEDNSNKRWDENCVEQYIDNLKVKSGQCTFEVIEDGLEWYLNIIGSSYIEITTHFEVLEGYTSVSLKYGNLNEAEIYSNTSNVSIILDAKRSMESDGWDVYHSSVINLDLEYPKLTKDTWKKHLSDEYYIQLNEGNNLYPVNEGNN